MGTSPDGVWRTGARTPSGATGPQKGDHTPNGKNFAFLESSSPNYAGSPPYKQFSLHGPSFVALSSPATFEFWYNMYGATMGTITLESYDGTAWSQLWAMKGNKGDVWRQASVSLPVGALKLRFTGQTTTSYTSDFALDDLVLKQGVSPTTQPPTPTTQPPQPTPVTTTLGDMDSPVVVNM